MRGSIVIEIVKPWVVFLVYFIIIIPIPIKLTMNLGVYIFEFFIQLFFIFTILVL